MRILSISLLRALTCRKRVLLGSVNPLVGGSNPSRGANKTITYAGFLKLYGVVCFHLDAADDAVIVGPAAQAELATHCGTLHGDVNAHHQRLHVARRLLAVQGVHDVTG